MPSYNWLGNYGGESGVWGMEFGKHCRVLWAQKHREWKRMLTVTIFIYRRKMKREEEGGLGRKSMSAETINECTWSVGQVEERTFLKRELPFVLGSKGGKLNATDDVEVESPSRRLLVLAYISSTTCYTFLRLIRHSSRRSLVFLFPALNVALRKARRASWFIQYNPSQMPPYWLMARGPLLSFVVFAPQRRH